MRALRATRGSRAEVVEEDEPAGDGVLVDVTFSSLNYKDALAVTGRPGVIRADTLIADGEPLVRPREGQQFDFEGELAVVIGKPGRRIPADRRRPSP